MVMDNMVGAVVSPLRVLVQMVRTVRRVVSGTFPRAPAALLPAALVVLGACSERLDESAACPITCTDASAQIQTVDLDAAIMTDTAVLGGLGLGTETLMLLASRGDTLDTRVIVRFDSLPSRSRPKAGDTTTVPINFVDSAYLTLRVDSAAAAVSVPVTLGVYDVDTPANDTSVAALAPLFTPERLITETTFAPGKLVDSARVPLPSSVLLAKAQGGQRLRLGLRLSSSAPVQTRISAAAASGPRLALRTSADTGVARVTLSPYSAMPPDNPSLAASLADFTLVVRGTSAPPPGLLAVGGLPARRVYLRFALPSRIVDSSLVVRATLLLTQLPSASPGARDSMGVVPALVAAGPAVTDPAKAAQIVPPPTAGLVPAFAPLFTRPAESGERALEIAPAFGVWAAQSDTALPRALVLASVQEEYSPQLALFYSDAASNPAMRPRLRISYTKRARIGTP